MTIRSLRNVLVAVAIAIGAAMAFLGAAGDGFSASSTVAEFLLKHLGITVNTVHTVLMIVLIILIVSVLIVVVKIKLMRGSDQKMFSDSEAERAWRLYLKKLGKNIEKSYNQSIHYARYLDLQLTDYEKPVSAEPNYTFYKSIDGSERTIQSINDLLLSKPYSYLLLGTPGAGKTTTLLNSISVAIKEAEIDRNASMPVFINLSTWNKKERLARLFRISGGKKQPVEEITIVSDFDTWLIKKITRVRRTGLTKDIVRHWLQKKQQLTFFLDGLDEADEAVRGTLVEKINAFLDRYPHCSVLISSRLADYEALVNTTGVKLELDGAVTIHPLTPEQIKTYLDAAETPQLQDLFNNDEELKEMARSPLELSIMVLACGYTNLKKLLAQPVQSITTKRIALFDAYVKAMVHRELSKRAKNRRSVDADYADTPVSEKRLVSLNKNLGWIAEILCRRSILTYLPVNIYEYLNEGDEHGSTKSRLPVVDRLPKKLSNIVTNGLIASALVILALCFIRVYPVFILIVSVPVFFTGYLVMSEQLGLNYKTEEYAMDILGWLIIMIAFPYVYIPFDYLMLKWEYGLWCLAIASGLFLLAISIISIATAKQGSGRSLSVFLTGRRIVAFVLAPLPCLYLFFIRPVHYQGLFIGMLACAISGYFLAVDEEEIRDIAWGNVYAISAAVAGLFLLKGEVGLNTLLIMQSIMIIAMIKIVDGISSYDKREALFYIAIAFFLGSFLGSLSGLFVAPLEMFVIAILLITTLSIVGRLNFGEQLYEKGLAFLGSQILLIWYKIKRKIPFRYKSFLQYATRTLLLKKSGTEYAFIHRRIRDYFAIREYMPLLEKRSTEGRANAITAFSRLKDASCDVLLEMIDDNDKDIRIGCLIGLGDIGTATAAKSIYEAVQKTSGDLQALAIEQIAKVKDIAAAPFLVKILNEHPFHSSLFISALDALKININRLSAWENKERMKEYVNSPYAMYIAEINSLLSNEDDRKLEFDLEALIEQCISKRGSDLTHRYNLQKAFCRLKNEELLNCIGQYKEIVTQAAFRVLCSRGHAARGTEKILQCCSDDQFIKRLRFKRDELKKMVPALINVISENDSRLLNEAFIFLKNFSISEVEEAILQKVNSYDTQLKLKGLGVLERIATKRSIPFLLQGLQQDELKVVAAKVLTRFPFSTLSRLIDDGNNKDICDQLILVFGARPSKKVRPAFLIRLLDEDNYRVKNAVIQALGNHKATSTIPLLLKLFNQKDERTLGPLVSALAAMQEKRIIPILPELFWQYPALQSTILEALVHLKADREITELYNNLLQNGSDIAEQDEHLQLLFAERFISTNKKMVIEIIFPLTQSESNKLLRPVVVPGIGTFQPEALYREVGEMRREYASNQNRNSSWISKTSVSPKGDPALHREWLLANLVIDEQDRTILDIAYGYDVQLARELALKVSGNIRMPHAIADQLQINTEVNRQLFLMVIVDRFRLGEYSVILRIRNLLDGNQEDKVTILAMQVLGRLEDDFSLNTFLNHLSSSNHNIVKAALGAINKLCDSKSVKIDNFYELVCRNSLLQVLLADHTYATVLNQLSLPELQKMAEQEYADLRYLAAIYSGILGHGKMIPVLNRLLNDNAVIHIGNGHHHSTVSEGALYALEMIGSPFAKSQVDQWKQKTSTN